MHVVLDPHPTPPRPVDAGLHRHHCALHERTIGRFGEARGFVYLQPDAVPEAVSEHLSKPAVLNVAPRDRVGIPTRHPRPQRLRRSLIRESIDLVELSLLICRSSDYERTSDVGAVPIHDSTDISQIK